MIIILNGWLPTVQFYSQRNARYATLACKKYLMLVSCDFDTKEAQRIFKLLAIKLAVITVRYRYLCITIHVSFVLLHELPQCGALAN